MTMMKPKEVVAHPFAILTGPVIRIVVTTILALIAFAANSVLCKMALGAKTIDASGFTIIRMLSGILVLMMIFAATKQRSAKASTNTPKGSWSAGIYLFIYALAFSFAYVSLDTGVGALILFTAVQVTMILTGLFKGHRFSRFEWLGLATAFSGFIYLILPSVSSPSLVGFVLMIAAGMAWAGYTFAGQGTKNPIADTAFNFLRTLPLVLALFVVSLPYIEVSVNGAILAILSGGVASGVGYAIWYSALRGLSTIQAAIVQLLVPIIAAIGGILFSNEVVSVRLIIATGVILGGISMVILAKHKLVLPAK